MSITIDRASARPVVTAHRSIVVDVVDGNGLEVAGQPVIAHLRHHDGVDVTTEAVTDGHGRARVEVTDDVASLNLTSGRESLGPIRPEHGTHLVIEM